MENISNPANRNPNSTELESKKSNSREEGELSLSEDEETPTSRAAQPAAVIPPIAGPMSSKLAEKIQPGRTISGNYNSRLVEDQTQSRKQPNTRRRYNMVRVPDTSEYYMVPVPVDDSNLVINFSDNDSGSDFEDSLLEKTADIKTNRTGVNGDKRPASSLPKTNIVQQSSKNAKKELMQHSSSGRSLGSSLTKINALAGSKGVGPSILEQLRARSSKSLNNKLANQTCGSNQGVGLNNGRVCDLRQQIALMESELKLKAAQQNKEMLSLSSRDFNTLKRAAVSAADSLSEPKESDRKRSKIGDSYSTRPTADDCLQTSRSVKIRPEDHHVVSSCLTNVGSSPLPNICLTNTEDYPVSSSHIISTPSSPLPNICNIKELNHSSKHAGSHHPPLSFIRPTKDDKKMTKSNQYYQVVSGGQSHKPPLDTSYQESLETASRWKCLGSEKFAAGNNSDMQSLNEILAELLEYLDEAEEHRRRCEVEDRNVFKAYLKAQTDLHEANTKCTDLYDRKMSYEAQFRSFSMQPSSVGQEHLRGAMDIVNVTSQNMNLDSTRHVNISSLNDMSEELDEAQVHRRRCEIEERNVSKSYRKSQMDLHEANTRCTDLDSRKKSYEAQFQSFLMQRSSGAQEPLRGALDIVNIRSQNMNMNTTRHANLPSDYDCFDQGHQLNVQSMTGAPVDISYQNVNEQNMVSRPCSQPEIITSEYRNKWDSTNGVRPAYNDPNISGDDEETSQVDHASLQLSLTMQQKEPNSSRTQKNTDHESNQDSLYGCSPDLLLETKLRSELFARLQKKDSGKNCGLYDSGDAILGEGNDGIAGRENSTSNDLISWRGTEEANIIGLERPEQNILEAPFMNQSHCYVGECLRSIFFHMKVDAPIRLAGSQRRNQHSHVISDFTPYVENHDVQQLLVANSMEESLLSIVRKDIDSYSCKIAVNSFWPLCMYELRGKCNDDECPWQHRRDFSIEDMSQHKRDDSHSAGNDSQIGLLLHNEEQHGARGLSELHNAWNLPAYLVSLGSLKAKPQSYQSYVSWRNGDCWQKSFSLSIALSNAFQKDFSTDECLVFDRNGQIEICSSWNKQPSYFQNRNLLANQLKEARGDSIQSLETAFLLLNQEVNKIDGMKRAFMVMSRALEAEPKSEILWTVYLLILYSNPKLVGKDDMFSYAVKHNEGSYVLWLMYINSRSNLDERLTAFSDSLSALCRHASIQNNDEACASAYILDLFLQQIQLLCSSENVDTALQKIYGLVEKPNDPSSVLVSDIVNSLSIADKCIFWICAIHLVIYRKLPDSVVHQFEFRKDIIGIKWPSTYILPGEKQRIVNLVEVAVDSALNNQTSLVSAHHFVINHVRCMAALDEECGTSLLEKYIKLYPSCLELLLMSARSRKPDSLGLDDFSGFEDALKNWPKDVAGIQCVWNQYAEYTLEKGKVEFTKELMVRWLQTLDKSDLVSSPDFSTLNFSDQVDKVFGYLNLSLHKLLQNDWPNARLAIDKALKDAGPDHLKYCIGEHAVFMLTNDSQLEDATMCEQLNHLKTYLGLVQNIIPVSEPLSRQFIQDIQKPRLERLIDGILTPVFSDYSIINTVLAKWYGPHLLPQDVPNRKELVDFVECVLEIVPSNYHLAFAVCRLLSRDDDNSNDVASASALFWASSTLVDTILKSFPIAPEFVWVEAAEILGNMKGVVEVVYERFFEGALSAYPFSVRLWKCDASILKRKGDISAIVEAARAKGIKLHC